MNVGCTLYGLSGCSGFSLSYNDYDNWNTNTNVSSHLCDIIYGVNPAHMAKNKSIEKCFGSQDSYRGEQAF